MNHQLLNKIIHRSLALFIVSLLPMCILFMSIPENSKDIFIKIDISQIEMPEYSEAETSTFANNDTENVTNYFCLPFANFLIFNCTSKTKSKDYNRRQLVIKEWGDIFIPPPNKV